MTREHGGSEQTAAQAWGEYWRHFEWPVEPHVNDVVMVQETSRVGQLLAVDHAQDSPYLVSFPGEGPDDRVNVRFKKGEVKQHFPQDKDRQRCAEKAEYDLRFRGPGGCLWSSAPAPKRGPLDKQGHTGREDLKEWDVDDPTLMEKVRCSMLIKVTAVDPKHSTYELRLKCKWRFRTLHSDERTETRLRVPGIRLPGLIVVVDESRIWRDIEGTKRSNHTILWRGMSRFTITGFERFEMHHFPFDRQIVSLDIFDFVWRSEKDKDTDEFDFSMQVAQLHVQTVSVLPEWDPYPAIVKARNEKKAYVQLEKGVSNMQYASRFTMRLRLERRTWFYILQAFGLTVLITISSIVPLCMPILAVGDRLSVYASGMLTLTSFKYSIAEQLPSVPYSNYMDWMLFWELICLMVAALESVLMYRYVIWLDEKNGDEGSDAGAHADRLRVRHLEDFMFFVVLGVWISTWIYFAADQFGWPFGKQHQDWLYVLENQDWQADEDELEDLNPKAHKTSLADVIKNLDRVNREINEASMKIAEADDTGDDVGILTLKLNRLQDKRAAWEEQLRKLMPRETKG